MAMPRLHMRDDRGRPVWIGAEAQRTLLACVVVNLVIFASLIASVWYTWSLIIAGTLIWFTFFSVLGLYSYKVRRDHVPRQLKRRRCASCRYDLRRSRAEADGCTVCAECGAAWRIEAGPGGELA